MDKLDGNIDNDLWKQFKNQWQLEIGELKINLEKHRRSNVNYIDYGVSILETCRRARLIDSKLQKYKNLETISEFLKEILDEITLKHGEISYKYKKPFDLFAKGLACTKNWRLKFWQHYSLFNFYKNREFTGKFVKNKIFLFIFSQ